jgi:NitT/TauT family transport system permease protein
LAGYFFATVIGVGLGILIGWFQKLEDLVFLPLELLRPIPAVAWIPLAILMFPDAESGMIYITFIGAFFPILISTIKGVEGVDMLLLRVGQCLGAGQWYVFKDIVVPGALPSIASGLVIGMGNWLYHLGIIRYFQLSADCNGYVADWLNGFSQFVFS